MYKSGKLPAFRNPLRQIKTSPSHKTDSQANLIDILVGIYITLVVVFLQGLFLRLAK